jgi:hypothetical protein
MPEYELKLCKEARFYYAPRVSLGRESTRCPDAQPVPRRAAASFNKRGKRTAAQHLCFDMVGFVNMIGHSLSALLAAVAHPGRSAVVYDHP